MGTPRILISGSRVAVSRPGIDVTNPPAKTEDYLAIDSSWGIPLRLYTSGLFSTSLAADSRISFGTTFGSPPYVLIMPFDPSSTSILHDLYMIFTASPDTWQNPYNINISTSSFILGPSQIQNSGYNGTVRYWIYYVFAP